MTGGNGSRGVRWRRRAAAWTVLGTALGSIVGSVTPQAAGAVPIRLTAAATPALPAEEQQLTSLTNPDDRAVYVLQQRVAEAARTAALLTTVQAKRHEAAMAIIQNMR